MQASESVSTETDTTKISTMASEPFFISTLNQIANSWREVISICGALVTYMLDVGAQVNICHGQFSVVLPTSLPFGPHKLESWHMDLLTLCP
jgi:hypothetical protein